LKGALLVMALCVTVGGCAAPLPERAPGQPAADAGEAAQDGLSAAGRALLLQSRGERQSGDYAAASASLERAIRIEPSQAIIWLELARVRLLEGNAAQAEQLARKAAALGAGDPSIEDQAAEVIAQALRNRGTGTN
jgi:Tfp pilus assembly protein PilF